MTLSTVTGEKELLCSWAANQHLELNLQLCLFSKSTQNTEHQQYRKGLTAGMHCLQHEKTGSILKSQKQGDGYVNRGAFSRPGCSIKAESLAG